MNDKVQKILGDPWIFTICVGGILLVAIGVFAFINRDVDTLEPAPRQNLPEKKSESTGGGPEAKIIDDAEFMGPVIRYTADGFSPKNISLTREDAASTDCLVMFKNESAEELVVRLGPWSDRDNRGFAYPPIPAGQTGIIDPRYSDIFSEELYNRKQPEHTLSVSLSEFCFQ